MGFSKTRIHNKKLVTLKDENQDSHFKNLTRVFKKMVFLRNNLNILNYYKVMTLKLIDLFDIKYISLNNVIDKIKFNSIEVHEILNINPEIRKQFILLVSTYMKNLYVIHIFKKFKKNDNGMSLNKLQYINSFSLSNIIENSTNWRDIDKRIKNIDEDFFIIDESYDKSILTEDYDFYTEIKNNFKYFTSTCLNELEKKNGGTHHSDSILWQVILSNTVTSIWNWIG